MRELFCLSVAAVFVCDDATIAYVGTFAAYFLAKENDSSVSFTDGERTNRNFSGLQRCF